jgi:hypothetical protein
VTKPSVPFCNLKKDVPLGSSNEEAYSLPTPLRLQFQPY